MNKGVNLMVLENNDKHWLKDFQNDTSQQSKKSNLQFLQSVGLHELQLREELHIEHRIIIVYIPFITHARWERQEWEGRG